MATSLAPRLLLLLSLLPQTLTLDPSNSSFYLPSFADASPQISLAPAALIAAAAVRLPSASGFTYTAPLRFLSFSAAFSFSVSRAGTLAFSLRPSNRSVSPSGVTVRYCAATATVQLQTTATTVRNLSGEVALGMSNGERMRSWIDYDGKTVEVRVARAGDPRPGNFSVACGAELWREAMLLRFGAWSGDNVSNVYSLEFVVRAAPYMMHSEPLDPDSILGKPYRRAVLPRRGYRCRVIIGVISAAVCGMLLVLALVFVFSVKVKGDRRQIAPVECSEEGLESGEEKIVLVGEKKK